jgi:ubiquitin carboxyl-terminal hydrolase L3
MFWMHFLDLAINSYTGRNHLDQSVCFADFEKVLLSFPSLMNASLWEIYYSKGLMFSEQSKDYWRLPDLKPLPMLTASPTPQKGKTSIGITEANSDRMLRFAFTVVQKHLTSPNTRRGFIIKHALSSLQSTTQRVRASNPTIAPYSETQAYFWIQVVHAAFASIDAISIENSGKSPISASQLSYTNFQSLYSISPTLWREHYSKKRWASIEARIAFTTPDLKPLPNFIKPKSTGLTHICFNGEMERKPLNISPELPSAEELAFLSSLINEEARTIPRPIPSEITSHAHLLLLLYERSVQFKSNGPDEKVSQPRSTIIDQLSGYHADSTTRITFWYEMVMKAVSKVEEDEPSSHDSFDGFLRSNQHLAYEDLPFCYYSQELWDSRKTTNIFLAPDRRSLTICEVMETKDAEKDWIVV